MATKRFLSVLQCLLACASGVALADNATRLVDCIAGQSIQNAIDKRNPDRSLTLVIRGTCTENVMIDRDDLALVGEAGARVTGTITIAGSRRVAIRTLIVSNPAGAGIVGTDNAAFTVEESTVERNGTDGIVVRNGAQATLNRNRILENGQANEPDTGRGIHANHGGLVNAHDNRILNNRSDGIGINNNSYGRLTLNTIEGNGRVAAGEAGVQVTRGRVRAGGNTIRHNTGLTAVIVSNHADYRTGSFLSSVDFPDNEFPFDLIEHAVDSGRLAVDVSNASYGDFRQADITGSISVGALSMMQVRGDDIAPSLRCATITVPLGGSIGVNGRGLLRLRFTRVTPALPGNPAIEIQSVCPPAL